MSRNPQECPRSYQNLKRCRNRTAPCRVSVRFSRRGTVLSADESRVKNRPGAGARQSQRRFRLRLGARGAGAWSLAGSVANCRQFMTIVKTASALILQARGLRRCRAQNEYKCPDFGCALIIATPSFSRSSVFVRYSSVATRARLRVPQVSSSNSRVALPVPIRAGPDRQPIPEDEI